MMARYHNHIDSVASVASTVVADAWKSWQRDVSFSRARAQIIDVAQQGYVPVNRYVITLTYCDLHCVSLFLDPKPWDTCVNNTHHVSTSCPYCPELSRTRSTLLRPEAVPMLSACNLLRTSKHMLTPWRLPSHSCNVSASSPAHFQVLFPTYLDQALEEATIDPKQALNHHLLTIDAATGETMGR